LLFMTVIPRRHPATRPASSGFTLIELLITISLVGLLMAMGMPSFNQWIINTRIRSAAEQLQNGLRLAQAEALRRNRQVVFSLTNADPALNAAATANAANWMMQTIPINTSETALFVQGGSFANSQQGVTVSGAAATCFNSIGRLVANTTTGVTATCTLPGPAATGACSGIPAGLPTFTVTSTATTTPRALCVTVALGGQVRMCDPKRSLASSPDGCPP
jgi:type IV fimbrial biogenesis protein FimT